MVKAEDIKVVLPCLFPNPDPLWMMLHTCKRFGIKPKLYGLGAAYQGWVDIKIRKLGQTAAEVAGEGFSHLLYIDARDAWFLTGLDEIAGEYNAMGEPPLMLSAQSDRFCSYEEWYDGMPWDQTKKFPYIGTPGMLCNAQRLADAFSYMQKTFTDVQMPDDDPPWWNRYIKERPDDPVVFDHDCRIFMNAGSFIQEGMWEGVLEVAEKDGVVRVHNKLTDSWPCSLHFNGGSSDALKGKWEWLEPHWRKFGYTENPPWKS